MKKLIQSIVNAADNVRHVTTFLNALIKASEVFFDELKRLENNEPQK